MKCWNYLGLFQLTGQHKGAQSGNSRTPVTLLSSFDMYLGILQSWSTGVEAAPREVQSPNLVQSEERAAAPLVSPRAMGQWGPWCTGQWDLCSKTHLLCSVLTAEAARAVTWPQTWKLCKIPVVPSKAGMAGAGDVSLGTEGKIPQAKVVLSIWRLLTKNVPVCTALQSSGRGFSTARSLRGCQTAYF